MKFKPFVLTDSTINSYGFTIDMGNLNLDRFEKNPVMLYNHYGLIGRWEDLKLEDGRLLGTPVFMKDKEETEAIKVKKRVEDGFLKGASVGIHILKWTEVEGEAPVATVEIIECSICDIPSNKNALVLYDQDGVKLEGDSLGLALEPIQKLKLKKEMKLSAETLATLGLKEGTTPGEIDAAIAKLSANNGELSKQLETEKEAKIESLMADPRIKEPQKKGLRELATTNFELAKSIINDLPVAEDATAPSRKTLAGKEIASNDKKDLNDRSDWTFKQWREKDTKGLLAIKQKDPERYALMIES